MLGSLRSAERLPLRFGSLLSLLTTSAKSDAVQVACILERNPLLKPELDEWEAEYKAWAQSFRVRRRKTLPLEVRKLCRCGNGDLCEKLGSTLIILLCSSHGYCMNRNLSVWVLKIMKAVFCDPFLM